MKSLLILIAATLTAAHASPPGIINHHGRIAADGTNINGNGYFKFAIVTPSATETLWTNDDTSTGTPGAEPTAAVGITINNGHYAAPLGAVGFQPAMTNSIPADIFNDHTHTRLRIWFSLTGTAGTFELLTPDRTLASAPYALTAATVPINSLTGDHIRNGTLTALDLRAGAVTANELGFAAVTTLKIQDGTITSADLAPGAIGPANLASSAVTTSNISGKSVTTQKIADNAVGTLQIAPSAVRSGDVADNSLTADDLASNSVTASELASNAVGTSEVIDRSLTSDDLASDSVTSFAIAAGAVGSPEIAAGAVTSSAILDGTITELDFTSLDIDLSSTQISLGAGSEDDTTQIGFDHTPGPRGPEVTRHLRWDEASDTFEFNDSVRATSFIPTSDRNAKTNFAEIDPATVLEKVAALPITTWTYKSESADVRHIGPVAQDFHAAFALGADDISINTIDADGVALAAIKALKAENDSLNRRSDALATENATLKNQLRSILDRLQKLETTFN